MRRIVSAHRLPPSAPLCVHWTATFRCSLHSAGAAWRDDRSRATVRTAAARPANSQISDRKSFPFIGSRLSDNRPDTALVQRAAGWGGMCAGAVIRRARGGHKMLTVRGHLIDLPFRG